MKGGYLNEKYILATHSIHIYIYEKCCRYAEFRRWLYVGQLLDYVGYFFVLLFFVGLFYFLRFCFFGKGDTP